MDGQGRFFDNMTAWCWQRLDQYVQQLTADDFILMTWLRGDRSVHVHVVSARIKKLHRSQPICICEQLNGQARFWASSDLDAEADTLLAHIARRWDIEVLFVDV